MFKTVAYHRAADAIARAPFDVAATYAAGERRPIPGVGQAIADKIFELATTGHMAYYEKLRAEIPHTLVDLLRIPGVGPKTVRIVWEALGIADLPGLKQAAQEQRLRTLKGISASTEERILEGIEKLETAPRRLLIHRAQAASDDLAEQLRGVPGVTRIVQAGSLRRRRESIGDLDLLVETADAKTVVDRFTHLGVVDQVLGAGQAKAAVTVLRGPQVDLMVMPPGEAGTYLIHFTGSADHNIRLRGIARDLGWSLSEKGFLRIDEEGRPLTGAEAELRTFEDEAGAYDFLGLAYIEPELREDRGEIEAARERPPADAHHPRRPPRRPAQPLRLERRRPLDRGHGRGRPPARLCLPGAHRPLAEPGHRPRADPGPGRGGARDHRRAQRPVRRRGGRAASSPRAPTRAASGSSTAASSRSAPTATSTTRTTSSPASTSSSPRSMSPAASRAPSSPGARSTRSARPTST